jgi:glycosyltransferase involved in cell wall biosynthesis
MRILMVSDFYPPIIGGLERHVQTLSRELVRRGHSVAVATLAHDGSPPYEDDGGVRIYRLPGWNRLLKPFYVSTSRQFHPTAPDPGVVKHLHHVMAKERPDVVHARGWMLYSYLAIAPRYPAKLVVTLHDYSLVCPTKTFMRHGHLCDGPAYGKCVRCASEQYGSAKSLLLCSGLAVSKRLHRRVDHYIAISEAVRAASVGASGAPVSQVEVIPTFVPDSVFAAEPSARRPAFLPAEDGYILFVGALAPHKGVNVLLEAYQGLEHLAPLVLIGADYSGSPIHYPPNVTVARDVAHTDVMAAWQHAALGVVPSIWPEPLGQVAVEAMARGKPVVASATGGLQEVVQDGMTGLLVPPGDVSALRAALRELLLDPARRDHMGRLARERARGYTVGAVVGRIERAYENLMMSRGSE